jgi:putative ABC transport system ATP-binding protein
MSEPPALRRPAVIAEGVTKTFDGTVRALRGVDLQVAEGEFVAITGSSGCGKSTLLHLMAALDSVTSGRLVVDGEDLSRLPAPDRYRREHVGLVFQLHNLLPQLSVLSNVEIATFGTGSRRSLRRARARKLLAELDLAGLERRLPSQLSGGERQRVAIARALVNEPRLLLADEPTGSLDSESTTRVLGVLGHTRARGVTVVMVTHDEPVAAEADRRIEMKDGRIVSDEAGRPSVASPR